MEQQRGSADYLARQVERSWDKESRNLQWFGLRDGMAVVDLGCGPGHFTARLAECMPGARITGVDADERSLALARTRLRDRATLVCASADDTGLPANAFDFVLARLLFQHLREPERVVAEACRLLKPGGKLVITDVDDALFGIVQPPMPLLHWLLRRYARSQRACGGNRHVGRELVALLRGAGFVEPQIECVATHSDQAGIDACLPQFDAMPLLSLVETGDLARWQYAGLRWLHRRSQRDPARYALVLNFMACGTKPGIGTGG